MQTTTISVLASSYPGEYVSRLCWVSACDVLLLRVSPSESCQLTVDLPLMSRGGQRKVKGAWRLPLGVAGILAGGSAALFNLCRVRVLLRVILCAL